MRDFIRLLCVKLKHRLSEELEEERACTDLSEQAIDDIIFNVYRNTVLLNPEEYID